MEQEGAGHKQLISVSTTEAACDLIKKKNSSYLNQMFSSAEASRHKVPAVKVNRNKALFPPHTPLPPSPTSFFARKTGNLFK